MGVSGVQGQYNFLDSTGAFTRNGALSFDRPADMVETEVGGQKNFWIRARINSGNYGAPGSYELVGQNWIFKEDRPLQPPQRSRSCGPIICRQQTGSEFESNHREHRGAQRAPRVRRRNDHALNRQI